MSDETECPEEPRIRRKIVPVLVAILILFLLAGAVWLKVLRNESSSANSIADRFEALQIRKIIGRVGPDVEIKGIKLSCDEGSFGPQAVAALRSSVSLREARSLFAVRLATLGWKEDADIPGLFKRNVSDWQASLFIGYPEGVEEPNPTHFEAVIGVEASPGVSCSSLQRKFGVIRE